jgi:anthranilate/para-aminobenzoate synthase component I
VADAALARELGPVPDAGECLARLAQAGVSRSGLAALDSAAGEPRRFSWIGMDPRPLDPQELGLGLAGIGSALRATPVDSLPAALAGAGPDRWGPFRGGFLGAVAYDLGVAGERALQVAGEPWGFPLMAGGIYGDYLVRREADGRGLLVLGAPWTSDWRARRAAELARALQRPAPPARLRAAPAVRDVAGAEHGRRIERLRQWIAAGELYQANLAHRLCAQVEGDPIDAYRRLRRANPAPYMGYLEWSEGAERRAILSSSPELLLEVDGLMARTQPIKGTAARSAQPEQDARAARELLASAKDLAELAMIVDLERNDLGRLARPGGVWVEGFPTCRSFARVHHLMADVWARLRPGVSALEVLAVLFPGGSVTGAPKLAALRAIAELEGQGRGFFCGAMGFVSAEPDPSRGQQAAFNLLIRTLLWRDRAGSGEVSFQVGGGITWSSRAAQEDQETMAKARALLEALASEGGE